MTGTRVFLTGVGGQGTLTATIILGQAAMDKGIDVTAGEVHGMAQRGGVVESTLLLGGYRSPRISHGEAHVLLGFEPLETLRALPYLVAEGGTIVSNAEPIMPLGVTMGRETYPSLDDIRKRAEACASRVVFLPCQSIGAEVGALQCGNLALLGAACATGALPLTPDDLIAAVKARLKPKVVDMNLKAIDLGVAAVS
ncbi:indolepyruvate ferredoxin oxidoreductase beta subunit [Desulfobaculum xiamenense]|uniref:Indolepyruvate ferredoxin oxidoreductase beta subunit n=1 Tax=Desulfobaculum xiamenense TaxID=995050 RepID=A0A846QLS9_9BACT|nr:indolepyruvate oxidoreductase subunit beta [Desulfobaculum xiamenense]NJB67412.1 indolepyruvate ferredoxin oxidoreductase beta subunit [Desulfobaculum xiamenense]